jgi:hypothetical protein
VPNIKAVLLNLTELVTGREEVVMRNSRIPEKANAICPPTFSGLGIKNCSENHSNYSVLERVWLVDERIKQV